MRFARLIADMSAPEAEHSTAMARLVEAKAELSESDETLAVRFLGAWGIVRWCGSSDPICEIFPSGGDDEVAALLMELAIPHFRGVEGMIKGRWIECEPHDTACTILEFEDNRQDDEPVTNDFPLALTTALVAASVVTADWAGQDYPLQGIPEGIAFSDGEFDRVRIVNDRAVITVELLSAQVVKV